MKHVWPISVLLMFTAAGCATVPPPAPPPAAPSYEDKLSWILRLEEQRVLGDPEAPRAPAPATAPGAAVSSPPPPTPPDLVALLSDTDARLRRRAALAVGRVGLAEGVAPLVLLLDDVDPDVRHMAAFALGLLRGAAAVPALMTALERNDVRLQGRAAEALGAIGDARAASAVGAMVARHASDPSVAALAPDDLSFPLSPPADAFRLGLYALVRLKAWEPLAAAVLAGDGKPRVAWWPVAYALQRIEDKRAVPALLAIAQGEGVEAVGFAARGLGVLADPRGVEVLVPLLDAKRDRRLTVTAARALGQIGRPAAAEPLRQVLRRPSLDAGTRVEVITALGLVKGRAALDDLFDLIGHPDPAVRGAALRAVAALDAESFVLALSGLDLDASWQVRADLALTLGTLDRERALPRLTDLAGDEDQRVVAAALRSLVGLKAPGVAERVRAALESDDLGLRATAASLAGELRPQGGEVWLRAAWERGRGDASYVARAAALAALARYGQAAARATLEEALVDAEWAVRLRASQLLVELDPRADVSRMRPAPVHRAAGDYRAPGLVAPAYSPQVYIDTRKGSVQLELAVLDAPLTVANFLDLARKGFYNGSPIHRVVPNFVVQAGDPRGDGEGGPGYTIRDEVNMRPYLRGTLGMALDWADTGGSQFFITHGPQPHLDGRYPVFGHVVAGLEVVDRLERWDVIERVRVWDGVVPPDAR